MVPNLTQIPRQAPGFHYTGYEQTDRPSAIDRFDLVALISTFPEQAPCVRSQLFTTKRDLVSQFGVS